MSGTATAPRRRARAETRFPALTSWIEDRERLLVLGAAGLAVLAGLVLAIHSGTVLKSADENQYWAIGRNVADHGSFSIDGSTPTAYRPPVWPLVLAAFHAVGLGVVAAKCFNALCLGAAALLAAHLARRIGGPAAAVLAALACAVYPLFPYTAATLFPQTLGTVLLLGSVVAAVHTREAFLTGEKSRALRLAAVSGLLISLLVLAVPSFAAPMGLVVLWLLLTTKKAGLPVLGALVGTAILLPAIWAARNEASMHAFVPVSTSDGINLILGNSEHAGGDTGTLVDISQYEQAVVQQHMDELQQDTYFRKSAITWATDNPGKAAVLYVEKTANYFSFSDRLASGGEPSAAQQALLAAAFLPVLGLVAFRLFTARRDRLTPDELLLAMLFVLSALFMAIFFTRVRFRLPLDSLAIVLAAETLTGLVLRRPRKTASR